MPKNRNSWFQDYGGGLLQTVGGVGLGVLGAFTANPMLVASGVGMTAGGIGDLSSTSNAREDELLQKQSIINQMRTNNLGNTQPIQLAYGGHMMNMMPPMAIGGVIQDYNKALPHSQGGAPVDAQGNPTSRAQGIAEVEKGEYAHDGYVFSNQLSDNDNKRTFAQQFKNLATKYGYNFTTKQFKRPGDKTNTSEFELQVNKLKQAQDNYKVNNGLATIDEQGNVVDIQQFRNGGLIEENGVLQFGNGGNLGSDNYIQYPQGMGYAYHPMATAPMFATGGDLTNNHSYKGLKTLIDDQNYNTWKNSLPINLQSEDNSYNLRGAYEAKLTPNFNLEEGNWHLSSRNPRTGLILKSPEHDTFDKAISADIKLGYTPYVDLKSGQIYTKKATGGDLTNQRIIPYNPGQLSNFPTRPINDKNGFPQGQISYTQGTPKSSYQSQFEAALRDPNSYINKATGAIKTSPVNIEDIVLLPYSGYKVTKALSNLNLAKAPKYIGTINIGGHPKDIKRAEAVYNAAKGYLGAQVTTTALDSFATGGTLVPQQQINVGNVAIPRMYDGGEIPPDGEIPPGEIRPYKSGQLSNIEPFIDNRTQFERDKADPNSYINKATGAATMVDGPIDYLISLLSGAMIGKVAPSLIGNLSKNLVRLGMKEMIRSRPTYNPAYTRGTTALPESTNTLPAVSSSRNLPTSFIDDGFYYAPDFGNNPRALPGTTLPTPFSTEYLPSQSVENIVPRNKVWDFNNVIVANSTSSGTMPDTSPGSSGSPGSSVSARETFPDIKKMTPKPVTSVTTPGSELKRGDITIPTIPTPGSNSTGVAASAANENSGIPTASKWGMGIQAGATLANAIFAATRKPVQFNAPVYTPQDISLARQREAITGRQDLYNQQVNAQARKSGSIADYINMNRVGQATGERQFGEELNQSFLNEQLQNTQARNQAQMFNIQNKMQMDQLNAAERDAVTNLQMNAINNVGTTAGNISRDLRSDQLEREKIANMGSPEFITAYDANGNLIYIRKPNTDATKETETTTGVTTNIGYDATEQKITNPNFIGSTVQEGVPINNTSFTSSEFYTTNYNTTATVAKVLAAIANQESGGELDPTTAKGSTITNNKSVHKGTSAYGVFQIMPANIPAWMETHIGKKVTKDYKPTAEEQAQIAVGEFNKNAEWAAKITNDPDEQVMLMAVKWYGNNGKPLHSVADISKKRPGKGQPSPYEYAVSVLGKTQNS